MDCSEYRILLVDDEEDVREFLSYNLSKEGFCVYTASDGLEAVELVQNIVPHLVILDVMMPEMDGIETCEKIRAINGMSNVLIAFLTARGEDYSQIAGFSAGADDYITKPIKIKVFISRVKALLKRYTVDKQVDGGSFRNVVEIDDLIIDTDKFIVIRQGVEISLPKKEFLMLALLASRPHIVFSRDTIFNEIWGDSIVVGDRTIDVHVRKLREKIGDNYIRTVKGVGYKYVGPCND